jgi:hypothetical protein
LSGQRVVYTLARREGVSQHGPDDILHIKAMSSDGLTGLSPVTQARLTLSLSSNLQGHAKQYFEEGSRPSGILSMPLGASEEGRQRMVEGWRNEQGGVTKMHRIAVVEGEAKFQPIAFSADDSQFLQQRELSAREVARIFRVPAWAIDAPTGDSLTYANTLEQNRAFAGRMLPDDRPDRLTFGTDVVLPIPSGWLFRPVPSNAAQPALLSSRRSVSAGSRQARPRLLRREQALRLLLHEGQARAARRRDRGAGGLVGVLRHRDGAHLRARCGRAQAR